MLIRLIPFLCFTFLFLAVNAQRRNALPFYKAGVAFKQANNIGEALNSFAKAVLTDKKFDSAYAEMGNIYSASGNIDLGISNYKKALAINPAYTAALIGMGKIYRDAKQNLDSAIIFYNAAELLDKTDKETYYALAWIYNAKKEYERAIPYAVKSLEIDNTYKPAYGELGHSYRATKKFAECIEQFKKNLTVSVVDVALLYSGYAYMELKDKTGAMQCYESLLKINERMAGALKKKMDAMAVEGN
jgi:tetratricopeptide (TPR) repeat protein